jgi:hypothetical protein
MKQDETDKYRTCFYCAAHPVHADFVLRHIPAGYI